MVDPGIIAFLVMAFVAIAVAALVYWQSPRICPNERAARGRVKSEDEGQLIRRGAAPDWLKNQMVDQGDQPYILANDGVVPLDHQMQRQIVQSMSH